jgi:hypothetical protein
MLLVLIKEQRIKYVLWFLKDLKFCDKNKKLKNKILETEGILKA